MVMMMEIMMRRWDHEERRRKGSCEPTGYFWIRILCHKDGNQWTNFCLKLFGASSSSLTISSRQLIYLGLSLPEDPNLHVTHGHVLRNSSIITILLADPLNLCQDRLKDRHNKSWLAVR